MRLEDFNKLDREIAAKEFGRLDREAETRGTLK